MDFYTDVTLAVLVVTAIGVFLGPLLAERKKKLNERRNSHFNKIKNECLKPLIASITETLWNNFTLREANYNYQSSLQHKDYLNSGLTDIKLWYSLTRNVNRPDLTLNNLLCDDLQNHFPELKESIDEVQKFLDTHCREYEIKRNELVIKLFEILESKIRYTDVQQQNNEIGMVVCTALFCVLDYDRSYWPNYYNITNSNGTLKIIRETIDNQEEIKSLGKVVKSIHDKARSKLPHLQIEMEKIIDYERDMKGKCNYI